MANISSAFVAYHDREGELNFKLYHVEPSVSAWSCLIVIHDRSSVSDVVRPPQEWFGAYPFRICFCFEEEENIKQIWR